MLEKLCFPALEAELTADLRRPTNRWVIVNRAMEYPASALAAVEERYCRIRDWAHYTLWEQGEGCGRMVGGIPPTPEPVR